MMIRTFNRSGITFQYPSNWTLEEPEAPDPDAGWALSIQSPDTAFLLVSLNPDAITPGDLAEQTLDALKAEYKDLEAEPIVEQVAGQAAVGYDVDFMTLDTAINCRTRCLETIAGPLLLMTQSSDLDRAECEPVLQAIVASLRVDVE
jgi:hypothetical protein